MIFFQSVMTAGILTEMPKKLKPHYLDMPCVHDNIGIIDNEEELVSTLNEYCDTTGICPVIHTVYIEDWIGQYSSLEDYTFDAYVNEFSDEQHFVIVYTISEADADAYADGEKYVPDYAWEAVQGDETDPVITESNFRHFGSLVQDALESGKGPGTAFNDAFEWANDDAAKRLDTNTTLSLISMLPTMIPVLIVSGVFVLICVLMIRNYVKGKKLEYVEVPLGDDAAEMLSAADKSGDYRRKVYPLAADEANIGKVSKIISIISLVVLALFALPGIGVLIMGINYLSSSDDKSAFFMIGFGVLWITILLISIIKMLITMTRNNKSKVPDETEHGTGSGGAPAIPQAEPEKTEFDPVFFNSSQSDHEEEDEEYRRMKRRGYE